MLRWTNGCFVLTKKCMATSIPSWKVTHAYIFDKLILSLPLDWAVSEKTPQMILPLLPTEYVTTFSWRTDAPEVRCDLMDRQTDRQTDPTTVTLAMHARRGLTRGCLRRESKDDRVTIHCDDELNENATKRVRENTFTKGKPSINAQSSDLRSLTYSNWLGACMHAQRRL